MNAQEINNKMSVDEHGTVVFDFTEGFDEKDLLDVLNTANQKAADHYRRNDLHSDLRATARELIDNREANKDLLGSLRPETIKALEKIPGGIAWYRTAGKPVIRLLDGGVIEMIATEN